MYGFWIVNKYENIISVYKETEIFLKKNPSLFEELCSFIAASRVLQDLIPQTVEKVCSGHFFPCSESYDELENAYQLCFFGFYKYSFIALRNVLELGLLSVYWDKQNKSQIDIQNWLKSKEDTPRIKEILSGLLKVKNIEIFSRKIDIQKKVKSIYNVLSDFVHTKGYSYSSYAQRRSNVNYFNKDALKRWCIITEKVIQTVSIVHLLKYPVGLQYYTSLDEKFGLNPPFGGFLRPIQQQTIKQIFNKQTLDLLQDISNKDEEAIELAKCVNDLPDITDEEFRKQMIEFDKFQIKSQGWDKWYKNKMQMLNSFSAESKNYKKHSQEIKKLKQWASKNNLIN